MTVIVKGIPIELESVGLAIYNQGRADAIEEIKQRFHNTYSASLYCQEDMATDCKEQGCNCDDCLYVMFNKVLEQLKE